MFNTYNLCVININILFGLFARPRYNTHVYTNSSAAAAGDAPDPAPVSNSGHPEAGSQPSPLAPPFFETFPGETPRAFSAFMAFFNLGHSRSLPEVADQLGEKPDTIKKWSSRFRWHYRIQCFNSGMLQQQAETEAALHAQSAADWARRTKNHREKEWETSQKLIGVALCFLGNFGDRDLEKMTLAQVSRTFDIASRIARQALHGAGVPEGPLVAPLQAELMAALKKAYSDVPVENNPGGVSSPPNAQTGSPRSRNEPSN
jgi:hypothetical protein